MTVVIILIGLPGSDVVLPPNEVAKDGAVVIVTMTDDVLRRAKRRSLRICVSVTSVSCDGWWCSLHYGDGLRFRLSCVHQAEEMLIRPTSVNALTNGLSFLRQL